MSLATVGMDRVLTNLSGLPSDVSPNVPNWGILIHGRKKMNEAPKSNHDDIDEFLEQAMTFEEQRLHDHHERLAKEVLNEASTPQAEPETRIKPGAPVQYSIYGPGYKPTSQTIDRLPPGQYDICSDNNGVFAVPVSPPSGLLLELPEMRSKEIIDIVNTFWESEKDYKEGNEFVIGGATYKAGIMIYGPPGSGKSCTIKLVSKKLIENGGTVFFGDCHPGALSAFLSDFAQIEPDRKIIVILEDFDSLIHQYSEARYLEILDSAKTIDNVLFIATTNYPDRLDPRIYNRPGRFSHVVKIGNPVAAAREAFLKAILKDHRDVEEIVNGSEGFSIDHLSALTNAVYREKKNLKDEMLRLRKLFKIPTVEEKGKMGI